MNDHPNVIPLELFLRWLGFAAVVLG